MTTATTQFVDVAGGQLEVQRFAGCDAAAPTIVFLHEALGSVSHWRDFPEQLCARIGAAGLVYSRFGHGQSSPLQSGIPRPLDFCMQEARHVLPALLQALQIERPYLVSHSDGGSIALLAAGVVPLLGLTAMAPHLHMEDITVNGIIQASRPREFFVDALAKHHQHPASVFDAWRLTSTAPAFRYWNLEPEMSRITCPTLLIQGLKDEYGSTVHVQRTQDAIRRAHPEVPVTRLDLPETRHVPWREDRETVIEAIRAHFASARSDLLKTPRPPGPAGL